MCDPQTNPQICIYLYAHSHKQRHTRNDTQVTHTRRYAPKWFFFAGLAVEAALQHVLGLRFLCGCLRACLPVYTHVCICTYAHMYIYIYNIYINMHVLIYVHIYESTYTLTLTYMIGICVVFATTCTQTIVANMHRKETCIANRHASQRDRHRKESQRRVWCGLLQCAHYHGKHACNAEFICIEGRICLNRTQSLSKNAEFVCIYVCMHKYMCIFVHRFKHTHTNILRYVYIY